MARSECFCKQFSCESVVEHIGKGHQKEDYIVSTTRRFRFIKDEAGAICGGGVVLNDIPTCRKLEQHEPVDKKINKPLNHTERRKQKRHK